MVTATVDKMATTGMFPWRGLGEQVDPSISIPEMVVKAGLNWGVEKRQMYYTDSDGKKVKALGKYALVRDTDDAMLSQVGTTYRPVQNEVAMDFFAKFVEAGHMTMEHMGSLWGGRYVWGLARVGKDFELGKGKNADQVRGYLLLLSPHVFGKALVAQFVPTRTWCWNTLNMKLGAGTKRSRNQHAFRMPHWLDFDDKTKGVAEDALGIASEQMEDFREKCEFLSKARAKPEEVEEYFCEILKYDPEKATKKDGEPRDTKTLGLLRSALTEAPGQHLPSATGTWWGALNAVTYVTDHAVGKDRETALKGAWIGHGARLKRDALELALVKAS